MQGNWNLTKYNQHPEVESIIIKSRTILWTQATERTIMDMTKWPCLYDKVIKDSNLDSRIYLCSFITWNTFVHYVMHTSPFTHFEYRNLDTYPHPHPTTYPFFRQISQDFNHKEGAKLRSRCIISSATRIDGIPRCLRNIQVVGDERGK